MTPGGRFFEDFRIGETIRHATPRTLTAGDASLYSALFILMLLGLAVSEIATWGERRMLRWRHAEG